MPPGESITPSSLSSGSGSAVLEVLTWLAQSALSQVLPEKGIPLEGERF